MTLLSSCRIKQPIGKVQNRHSAIMSQPGGISIYIDRIPSERLVATPLPDSSSTYFYSLQVTFEDSSKASYNDKTKASWSKYFQFESEVHWKLVNKGDSILPVFFQPLIKKSILTDAGILLFEVPKGDVPDTLFYDDQFNKRHQVFILKD